ncbi:MAG: PKD domain-containing protein, partial [Bacteroidota bacterium]
FGDATSSFLKNPVKTYNTPGIKIVQLLINDSFGCTHTVYDTFTVSSPTPTCNASFTKTISGLTVTFNNTSVSSGSVPSAVHYNWSFSDGTFSDLKNPVKTYATSGYKFVQLTVYDSSTLCYSFYSDSFVVVGPGGACAANFSKTVGSGGLSLTFNNTSLNTDGTTAGLSYYWYFSDGTSSTLKNPTKTFSTGGYKTIQLSITDTILGCFSTKIDSIILTPTSSGSCAANFTRSVSGLTVTLNNTSLNTNGTSTGLSYYWYFSDGTSSTLQNPVKTFSTGGTKTVQLTISDSSQGCFSTKTETIALVPSTCVASFTSPWIAPLTLNLTSTSVNSSGTTTGLTYHWVFSDGTTSSASSLVKSFPAFGFQWTRLTIIDSLGCTSSRTDSIFFRLPDNGCAADFSYTISGLTITFTNTSLNADTTPLGLSYLWNFGDGTFSTLKNPVKTYPIGGVKTVNLTVSDSTQGCYASKPAYINIKTGSCNASFTKTISGFTVSLNNTSLNTNGTNVGLSYLWSFSDGTSSTLQNPVKTFATGGGQTITLTISDGAQGCTDSYMDTVVLTPLCSASFTLATDTTTPFHFFLLNTSIIRPTSTFFWTFGDGGTSTLMTPAHTYASFGRYYVCLTVADSVCTSTYCDSIGMDSTGRLLKGGAFGFETLDFTTVSTTTGTAEVNALTECTIYPNPSNGDVHIDFTLQKATPLTLQVTDITGKVVFSQKVDAPSGRYTETIDMRDFKSSTYFLSIISTDGQKNYKLIKN